jgi:hypothetical protein
VRLAPLLLFAIACQKAPKTDVVATGSAPSSASVAPSAAAAPAKPWFEGSWQGAFQAELNRLEVPVGGVKEWKQDDGQKSSGAGLLSFEAGPDGGVTGTATGALGELTVAGRIEGDRAALTLTSAQADGFHGVILASQTPEGLKGTLSASSGDSLQVRRASVTLTRAK